MNNKIDKKMSQSNDVFFPTNMQVMFLMPWMPQNNKMIMKMANLKIKITLFMHIK